MFKKILLGVLGLLLVGVVTTNAADISFTVTELTVFGNMRVSIGEIGAVSTPYDTLGWVVSPPKFGLSEVSNVTIMLYPLAATAHYKVMYDYTNDKVMLFDSADGATYVEEADAGTVIAKFYWVAFGR